MLAANRKGSVNPVARLPFRRQPPPHERRGAELPRDIHSLMAAHHASRDRVRQLAAERE